MKLLKPFLRILVLFPILSVLAWHFASGDQRANYLPWVHQIVKVISRDQVPQYFQLPVKYIYRTTHDRVGNVMSEQGVQQLNGGLVFGGGHGFVRYHCIRPETSKIATQEQLVYQWEDALGNSHMGDRPPPSDDVRNLRRVSLTSKKSFELKLNEEQANLPAFARDRFQSEITQIYSILEKDWQLDNLRQTHINLRLIDDQERYNDYQQKLAPSLGTTSGFYSPRHNEAVIHTAGYAQRTYSITRHEVTHAILAGLYGQLPTWFNEGVAEYFTGMALSGQSKVIPVAEHHIRTLEIAHKAQRLPDLRIFFDVASDAWYQDVNKADRYAMSWALVFFLRSHAEGQVVMKQFMDTLGNNFCKPIDTAAFFDAHYPGRLDSLQKKWLSWLFSERKQDQRY